MKAAKVLILLDMNQTLILRKKELIKCHFKPDVMGEKKVYFRPGYDDFLVKVLAHPKAVVGIYSSMVISNVELCTAGMLANPKLKNFKGNITLLFDKKYNVHDPTGKRRFGTMRDLKKIWEDPRCKGVFGPKNTIMVDNERRKVRRCEENAIIVDSFVAEHLMNCKPNNHYYLNELANYLVKLLDSYTGDVRKQLKSTPFTVDPKAYYTADESLTKFVQKESEKTIIQMEALTLEEKKE